MDSAIVGLVGVLVGGVMGAVTEALRSRTAFRRDKSWELVEAQRARLERLYETVEEVAESYGQFYGRALHIAGTQSMPARDDDRAKVPWAKLHMLTNLYFPALRPAAERIRLAGGELGGKLGALIMDSRPDFRHNAPLLAAADASLEEFNKAITDMRAQLESASAGLAITAQRDVAREVLPGR